MLVLQGGGALGAYQVGVVQALHEAGIEPDWVIGTSIGAINAALMNSAGPLVAMLMAWLALGSVVRPLQWVGAVLSLVGIAVPALAMRPLTSAICLAIALISPTVALMRPLISRSSEPKVPSSVRTRAASVSMLDKAAWRVAASWGADATARRAP